MSGVTLPVVKYLFPPARYRVRQTLRAGGVAFPLLSFVVFDHDDQSITTPTATSNGLFGIHRVLSDSCLLSKFVKTDDAFHHRFSNATLARRKPIIVLMIGFRHTSITSINKKNPPEFLLASRLPHSWTRNPTQTHAYANVEATRGAWHACLTSHDTHVAISPIW